MVYTGAVKNMFGAVAGTQKADFHLRMPDYDRFADSLIDIFLSVKPSINLMDAIEGMEGYGPSTGNPRHLGVLLASADGFALDATAAEMIGLPIERIPVLKQAKSRGFLGEDIQTLGEPMEDVMVEDFNIPVLNEAERFGRFESGLSRLVKGWLRPRPVVLKDACVQCGNCVRNCPPKVISMGKGEIPVIDYNNCIRCFCCHELCSHKAVIIKRSALSRMMLSRRIAGLNKN